MNNLIGDLEIFTLMPFNDAFGQYKQKKVMLKKACNIPLSSAKAIKETWEKDNVNERVGHDYHAQFKVIVSI